jgi:hypothetical protein
MIEIIRHSLGLCGESHPSVLTFLISGLGLSPLFYYIGYKLKGYYDKVFP